MTNPGPPPASPVPGQTLTLVAAVGRNGALGRDGGLIWHLPGDLPRFKALTIGRPMIEGRRTYDAIGRALPGRRTIVVTRDDGWHRDDAETAGSIEQALALAGPGEVTCGGGGEIYALALPTPTGWSSPRSTTHRRPMPSSPRWTPRTGARPPARSAPRDRTTRRSRS